MHRIALPTSVLVLLIACSSSTTTSDSAPSSAGASGEQVDSCKQSCDKMKFFACNSASEQAACYDDCNKATSDQIKLFDACAQNSICDPECRTTITPKPADGGVPQGTGATAATCTSACQKLVSCSFIKVGDQSACETECGKSAYQYQIDCINGTDCGKIKDACGGGTDTGGGGGGSVDIDAGDLSVIDCQQACDSLLFFSCITATDQSACRARCSSTTQTKRETFVSCTNAAGPECTKSTPCYTTFSQ